MIIPDWAADRVLFGDTKPIHPLTERVTVWTPRELIEALEKWKPDEPVDVYMQNNPLGGPEHPIILRQGTNTINLNGRN